MSKKIRGFQKHVISGTEFEVDVRYVNLKPIGRGSYGLVCSADDLISNKKVAIKKIGNVFTDLIDAKRILREIMLLRHFEKHDNIVGITDLFTLPYGSTNFEDLYIVTELFECDLDRIIASKQALTESHWQFFLYQVLRGLKYIHSAKVLHRDLKPGNLLVNADCHLTICDFGLARGTGEHEGPLTEYVVTRWYRAPELLVDNKKYDNKVDVWSVGCIFGELIRRKPLFRGDNYKHQLELLIRGLGSQKDEDLKFVDHAGAKVAIKRFGLGPILPLESYLPPTSADAVDLLRKMLTFNPEKRISIDEALAHPFLKELHNPKDEPVCKKEFDPAFEKSYPIEIPKPILQGMMYRLVL
eukprot:TRINITY_DN4613_c0_g1_i2.p1 TRINITY_DN4613_c0_g1~~TRINITY_DN4613_c0_g1_i2.p1  ORF type:complete len:356 (-),score=95.88 TRINITY_DN4613_c0_g1_i2:251-1318(-)